MFWKPALLKSFPQRRHDKINDVWLEINNQEKNTSWRLFNWVYVCVCVFEYLCVCAFATFSRYSMILLYFQRFFYVGDFRYIEWFDDFRVASMILFSTIFWCFSNDFYISNGFFCSISSKLLDDLKDSLWFWYLLIVLYEIFDDFITSITHARQPHSFLNFSRGSALV